MTENVSVNGNRNEVENGQRYTLRHEMSKVGKFFSDNLSHNSVWRKNFLPIPKSKKSFRRIHFLPPFYPHTSFICSLRLRHCYGTLINFLPTIKRGVRLIIYKLINVSIRTYKSRG